MQGDLPKMVRTWRNQSAPSARFRRRRRRESVLKSATTQSKPIRCNRHAMNPTD